MKLRSVLGTCSHADVAQAALMSIGGVLAAAVAVEAQRRREPLGPFVAGLVRDFEGLADTCVWAGAEQAMQGSEQPVLAGLYVVIAHGLLRRNLLALRDQPLTMAAGS